MDGVGRAIGRAIRRDHPPPAAIRRVGPARVVPGPVVGARVGAHPEGDEELPPVGGEHGEEGRFGHRAVGRLDANERGRRRDVQETRRSGRSEALAGLVSDLGPGDRRVGRRVVDPGEGPGLGAQGERRQGRDLEEDLAIPPVAGHDHDVPAGGERGREADDHVAVGRGGLEGAVERRNARQAGRVDEVVGGPAAPARIARQGDRRRARRVERRQAVDLERQARERGSGIGLGDVDADERGLVRGGLEDRASEAHVPAGRRAARPGRLEGERDGRLQDLVRARHRDAGRDRHPVHRGGGQGRARHEGDRPAVGFEAAVGGGIDGEVGGDVGDAVLVELDLDAGVHGDAGGLVRGDRPDDVERPLGPVGPRAGEGARRIGEPDPVDDTLGERLGRDDGRLGGGRSGPDLEADRRVRGQAGREGCDVGARPAAQGERRVDGHPRRVDADRAELGDRLPGGQGQVTPGLVGRGGRRRGWRPRRSDPGMPRERRSARRSGPEDRSRPPS